MFKCKVFIVATIGCLFSITCGYGTEFQLVDCAHKYVTKNRDLVDVLKHSGAITVIDGGDIRRVKDAVSRDISLSVNNLDAIEGLARLVLGFANITPKEIRTFIETNNQKGLFRYKSSSGFIQDKHAVKFKIDDRQYGICSLDVCYKLVHMEICLGAITYRDISIESLNGTYKVLRFSGNNQSHGALDNPDSFFLPRLLSEPRAHIAYFHKRKVVFFCLVLLAYLYNAD
jgi:hypothetical protein